MTWSSLWRRVALLYRAWRRELCYEWLLRRRARRRGLPVPVFWRIEVYRAVCALDALRVRHARERVAEAQELRRLLQPVWRSSPSILTILPGEVSYFRPDDWSAPR